MSLYGGIKFGSIGDEAAAAGGSSTQDKGSNGNGAAPATSSTSVSGASTSKSIPKATGEWSASLKFAPRVNKPKPPTSSRTPGSGGFGASAHSGTSTPTSAISQSASPGPAGPGSGAFAAAGAGTGAGAVIERSADIVRSAEPKLVRTDEVMLGPDGKPLARAPAMTLAQDKAMRGAVSGSGPTKRDRDGRGENKRKKKKKKKQHIVPLFDPEEQYDPNKPNDLGEYQAYRKRLREERRARLLEEKRRRAAGEDSEGSSYYTDSEEDAPRRDAPRMFAPPKMYSPPKASAALPPSRSTQAPPAAPALASASTGDDAYARRQAMAQASSGDDAYARRAAMAQPASGDDAYAARAAMSQIDPGEDAYARRMAMSQQQPPPFQPPPPPPSFVPAPPPSFTPARPPHPISFAPPPSFTPTLPQSVPTPPQAMTSAPPPPPAVYVPPPPSSALSSAPPPPSGIPGFGTFTPPAPPAPAPVPPTAAAAPPPSPADFQKLLQEKMQAASAIAAKYAHLSPVAPPAPPTTSSVAPVPPPAQTTPLPEEEGGTFAEKMMRRWGHKEGSGLGASGSGIVHALTTEHVESAAKPVDPNQPLSKRQIAKQKAAAANVKNRKWVQHAHARGRIVNANEDEQAAEDKARLGEASRVICLRGMVGSVDDVDEDLADEIGEECSNYGIVERVVLHMVEPPPPEPSECLRIFVVFSGMAGAWRATKELDGRFFGGRKIRATYFDEATFDAGARDGEI